MVQRHQTLMATIHMILRKPRNILPGPQERVLEQTEDAEGLL